MAPAKLLMLDACTVGLPVILTGVHIPTGPST